MKILLDTNFLVYCAQKKIDYGEIDGELLVFSTVVDELKKLIEKGSQKDKEGASVALLLLDKRLENNQVHVLDTDKLPDEAIIENLGKFDAVATMDRELKKKLNKKKKILSIRGENSLGFI